MLDGILYLSRIPLSESVAMVPKATHLVIIGASLTLACGLLRGQFGIVDYFSLRKTKETLLHRIKELKQKNMEVSREIEKIKKSPSYARKVLKDRYHVTEADEHIIFFTE